MSNRRRDRQPRKEKKQPSLSEEPEPHKVQVDDATSWLEQKQREGLRLQHEYAEQALLRERIRKRKEQERNGYTNNDA